MRLSLFRSGPRCRCGPDLPLLFSHSSLPSLFIFDSICSIIRSFTNTFLSVISVSRSTQPAHSVQADSTASVQLYLHRTADLNECARADFQRFFWVFFFFRR